MRDVKTSCSGASLPVFTTQTPASIFIRGPPHLARGAGKHERTDISGPNSLSKAPSSIREDTGNPEGRPLPIPAIALYRCGYFMQLAVSVVSSPPSPGFQGNCGRTDVFAAHSTIR